ncbi:MAG: 4-hydroxythreonine-4-phosphate dehydrogenase PdxA [Tannerella sp.]|jgi:4-hydroxythreonine-4-phosphate dehydrogenase|nr:4-hydroxythreonine-4-phosphate dehydrogenase PdxA [Tannerella sp.]
MDKKLIKTGITQGDINGIGYEVILKTFADERMTELCTPIIYGSHKIALHYEKTMELPPLSFKIINRAEDAHVGKVNIINCVNKDIEPEISKSTHEAGKAAYAALEAAVADMKRGALDVLVTAPVNKYNINSESFHFPGHTEYLEEYFGKNGTSRSLMILLNDHLRVALVTGHIPVAEIKNRLTQQGIMDKLLVFSAALKQDFGIIRPRIAVLALNPHAGDKGLLGEEEETMIAPAIREAEKRGVVAFGPYAADGFFGSRAYLRFDGVLAMYHDQGLAPFKALTMDNGVNYTAGLPIVRTSPAHGTAYDIAGQNKASEKSFRQAVYVAMDVYRNRQNHREITANPLQKQYVSKGADNVKLDLTKEDSGE